MVILNCFNLSEDLCGDSAHLYEWNKIIRKLWNITMAHVWWVR
jgi:hypothetical protein